MRTQSDQPTVNIECSEWRKAYVDALSVIPDEEKTRLLTFIDIIESIPTLDGYEADFSDGYSVTCTGSTSAWCPPNKTYDSAHIYLDCKMYDSDSPCSKADAHARAIYIILHELGHALGHLELRDQQGKSYDAEIYACSQAIRWLEECTTLSKPVKSDAISCGQTHKSYYELVKKPFKSENE